MRCRLVCYKTLAVINATARANWKLLARAVEPAPRKGLLNAGARRRLSEGTEPSSRRSQILRNRPGKWMPDTEHALRDPFYLLKRRHGLARPSAEILDRPVDVLVERLRVNTPHLERECLSFTKNASRHGNCSAQQ